MPKRSEIETAAKRFRSRITDPGNIESSGAIAESAAFSQMTLGSVADQIGQKRLLIVSDGLLQYTPFAALPVPSQPVPSQKASASSPPLMVEHEIVNLPSASTLSLIRQDTNGRKPAPKSLAIFANPIFDSSDSRLRQNPTILAARTIPNSSLNLRIVEQQTIQKLAKDRGLSLAALPGTQQEADQIMKLVPEKDRYTAFDLNANKANATQPELAQ